MNYPNESDVLSNLKYISSFKAGDKIDVKNYTSYHQGGIVTNTLNSLSRTVWGGNRQTTYDFINATLNASIIYLKSHAYTDDESDKNQAKIFIKDLRDAKPGAESQMETYDTDLKLIANYKTLFQAIYSQVDTIEKSLFGNQLMNELTGTSSHRKEKKRN